MCYQKNLFLLLRPLFKIAFSKYFQPHIKDQTSLLRKIVEMSLPLPPISEGDRNYGYCTVFHETGT